MGGVTGLRRVLAALGLLLAVGGTGCLPSGTADSSGTETAEGKKGGRKSAEVMVGKTDDPQHDFWREQYKRNRTVPPQEFTVRPKKPRNNDFGEFDETLYAGLDAQPQLPGGPGGFDLMPMMGGAAEPPSTPQTLSKHRTAAPSASRPGPARSSMAAATAKTLGVGNSGLMTEERFYPVEQLVFGGEFPDLDKPESYRLMPKDMISITVKDHPEFSGKLEIQPDGTVRVPNLPDLVRLRGMTVDEAAEELRRMLDVYVKGECVVRVQTNRARGGYYFVFGDVLQPGRFPMGLEPVKLSDAVLAANWEASPGHGGMDDEELGPAFPTATARGKFIAPRTADLANVMLVTPHRSQPVRTTHDVRQALLGMMRDDPPIRPGQIIVVPSLDPRRNASLGLDMPEDGNVFFESGAGSGFSGANAPARLPELGAGANSAGYGLAGAARYGTDGWSESAGAQAGIDRDTMMDCLTPVQRNMARNFAVQRDTEATEQCEEAGECNYEDIGDASAEMDDVPEEEASDWRSRKPRESAIPVPGTEVSPEEYSSMRSAGAVRKTEVTGIGGGANEMVEVRTPRGRRLVRRGQGRTGSAGDGKREGVQDLKRWNMGM